MNVYVRRAVIFAVWCVFVGAVVALLSALFVAGVGPRAR